MLAPLFGAAAIGLALAAPAHAADPVTRNVDPTHHFPIATAIEVPAGYSTIYLSGTGADVADKSAPANSIAAYGDTEAQTRNALEHIQDQLAKMNLTLGDIIQMHVYMAVDPKLGKLDFPGMMRAYKQFFGTKGQPNLPTRSAFQVAALANPGWLVEIEVTAVRAPHS